MRFSALLGFVILLLAAPAVQAQTTTTTSTSTSSSSSTSTSTLPPVTWNVVRNADCTADIAATGLTSATVNCCTALGFGFCDRRENWGALFVRQVTFTSAAGQLYSTSGNAVNAANLSKIAISNIVWISCDPTTLGYDVIPKFTTAKGTRGLTIWLYTSGGTQVSGNADISNQAFSCLIYGY